MRVGKAQVLFTSLTISSVAFLAASCMPPKSVVKVPVEPMPGLATKVYSADDYDWAGKRRFRLELRETGRTDTVSNQILEKYLANQVVKSLCRKGWVPAEDSSDVVLRLYFGVKEKTELTSTTLVYGSSTASTYSTGYGLLRGVTWNASQLAASSWSVSNTDRSVTFYEANISVELTEPNSSKQIWRGDVRLRLGNDDIRSASGLMIRELLWQLPSYDYPPVLVPELKEEEFDGFWKSWVVGREFCAPGQQLPMTFDYAYYEAPRTLRRKYPGEARKEDVLREAQNEFAGTQSYQSAKRRSSAYTDFDLSSDYWQAFEKWVLEVWNPREARVGLLQFAPPGVAVADLLMHAPWCARNEDESIVLAGRYFIGEDTTETLLGMWARPFVTSYLDGVSVRYAYQRYYVTRIELLRAEDFKRWWQEAAEQRQSAFGRTIDFVPQEPISSPPIE